MRRLDVVTADPVLFDPDARDRLLGWLVERAEQDERVTAAAVVGSVAAGRADRWSDLDLTLGVAEGVPVHRVRDDWTHALAAEHGAHVLLDLHSGGADYRVLLVPGLLQVDLSFAPGGRVLVGGGAHDLLFGSTAPLTSSPRTAADVLGWAVVLARHGHVCLQRGRVWQAVWCVDSVRTAALDLACIERDLSSAYARAHDDLPAEVLAAAAAAVPRGIDEREVVRALRSGIALVVDAALTVPAPDAVVTDLRALLRAAGQAGDAQASGWSNT